MRSIRNGLLSVVPLWHFLADLKMQYETKDDKVLSMKFQNENSGCILNQVEELVHPLKI